MAKVNKDVIEHLHDHDIHDKLRLITLFSKDKDTADSESGVDHMLAERLIKNLTILESINKEPITIILNTPGGDWYHGMAIYDAIAACKAHVTVKGIGQVMSMGSVIMQAADSRVLYPNAKMMIHYGDNALSGHSKIVKKWAEDDQKNNAKMEEIFLEKIKQKHPDFDIRRLKKMLDYDTILSAAEAVNYGLADSIEGSETEEDGSE